MSKIITLADIQAQMKTIDWMDMDDRPLTFKVEQLEDGIGVEFAYADSGEFFDFDMLGETLEDALLEAHNRTDPTPEEQAAADLKSLLADYELLRTAIRALLDERGVSEVTLGKLYIYATVDDSADVIEREADHA